MKFLTDFLRRLKLKKNQRRASGTEISSEASEDLKSPKAPESPVASGGLSEKPERWKRFKIVGGICAAVGVISLLLVLWRFFSSDPSVPAPARAAGPKEPKEILFLSAVEKELFQAIRDDDVDAVRRCLSLGANVNAAGASGVTPLKAAVALNRTGIVRALRDRASLDGATLDEGYDDSGSSLIYAVVQNRPEIVRELLKPAVKGGTADKVVNKIDKNGYTPLMYAIDRNHTAAARELLNAGADVGGFSKEGYTPLMMAVTVGKADMIAMLLKAGADLDAVSRGGETAMSIARRRNRQVVISLLAEAAKAKAGNRSDTEASLALRKEEAL
ncbi:MAG: ankyrin repeat domain-containing protein [Synergistaceae bacterium]|jgi:hypothetical protein|nr:ankyrin repeat domain-containing protein [Synergistaceae bacterium]